MIEADKLVERLRSSGDTCVELGYGTWLRDLLKEAADRIESHQSAVEAAVRKAVEECATAIEQISGVMSEVKATAASTEFKDMRGRAVCGAAWPDPKHPASIAAPLTLSAESKGGDANGTENGSSKSEHRRDAVAGAAHPTHAESTPNALEMPREPTASECAADPNALQDYILGLRSTLAAALERVEDWKRAADGLDERLEETEKRAEQAEHWAEEAERNAKRYRWLSKQGCGKGNPQDEQCYLDLNARDLELAIDAAIDVARSQGKE